MTQAIKSREFITEKIEKPAINGSPDGLAVFSRPPNAPWKQNAIDKISQFQKYKDNWDEEGAREFSEACITQSLNFLRIIVGNPNLPEPQVVIGYENDIVFFWSGNGYELQVSVMPDGRFWLSFRESLARFKGSKDVPLYMLHEVIEPFKFLAMKI